MTEQKYTETSHKLQQLYIDAFFDLSAVKRLHFIERLYSITGDKRYIDSIAELFLLLKTKRIEEDIMRVRNKKLHKPIDPLPSYVKRNTRRKKREALYKKHPTLFFYNGLLWDLFTLQKHRLEKTHFQKEFRFLLSHVRAAGLKSLYIQDEVIRIDSSFAVESIYYLYSLRVVDLRKDFANFFARYYIDNDHSLKRRVPDDEFISLVYSLTHSVIAASNYYDHFVIGHNWILKFFEKNVDEIIERCNLDQIAEVALAFRLCQREKEYSAVYKRFRETAVHLTELDGMKDTQFLYRKEHSSSIVMMLCDPWKRFKRSPDLSKHPAFGYLVKSELMEKL